MKGPSRLKGVSASIGVAVGPAWVLEGEHRAPRVRVTEGRVPAELERFARAVCSSRAEIEAAKQELTQQHGPTYAPILDVYLLMHGDALLIDAVNQEIRDSQVNAEWAVEEVTSRLMQPLLADSSSYFRERANDIEHVKEHLIRHLTGERRREPAPDGPCVLIARDLTPADAVRLLGPPTVALVTELGAGTSHTAVLARAFGVPAVVGVGPLPDDLEDGEPVLVDGFSGEVTVRAPVEEQGAAEERRDRFNAFLRAERATSAVTLDGVSISVTANVELPSEVEAALENGAEGIGLYRTEFMCLDRDAPPSEEEQLDLYRRVISAMAPKTVVFRTFDWRGDKRLRAHDLDERARGWLETQVKALLRASCEGSTAIMFPMVATLDMLRDGKDLVARCRTELSDQGAKLAPLPIGMMVEVPSAALLADRFAEHADFFAVGTNDLAQYTLAFDRHDSRAGAAPLDPAVLRLLERAVSAANGAGIDCSICGGMASDPVALGLAVGLGYRKVSVPVSVVPLARAVIRNLDLAVAAAVARDALRCSSADAVRQLVIERLGAQLGLLWQEQGLV